MKKLCSVLSLFLLVCCSYSNQSHFEQYVKAYNSYIKGNLTDPLLEAYIRNPSRFVPGLILKGKVFFIKGDLIAAEKAFEKALAIRSSSIEGKIWYARTLYYKRLNNADINLEKTESKIHSILIDVLTDDPDNIEAHALFALIAKDKREHELQIEHLNRIIQYSDELAYALVERARVFWIQNKVENARADLTLALAFSQSNTNIQNTIKELITRIENRGGK